MKFVSVGLAIGLLLGIIAGPIVTRSGEPSQEQSFANAKPAESGISRPATIVEDDAQNIEKIENEIAVITLLEGTIAKRSEEYESLITEITRLRTIRATFEGEIDGIKFVSRATLDN